MEQPKCSLFFFFLLLHSFSFVFILAGSDASACKSQEARFRKLFVFGDSYGDTGNLGKLGPLFTPCWYEPYGMTFPRRPAGRFSDGRVFTDYFASFLGIRSPIPFKYRTSAPNLLSFGINFAVGGSGVFDTGNLQRNLAGQIDAFALQINNSVFADSDLDASIALVLISGNDYEFYESTGGSITHVAKFIDSLIKQLKLDLKRIHELGVKKVAVTNLHPLGCTPFLSKFSNYDKCNGSINLAVGVHNLKLRNAMNELKTSTNSSAFISLDFYSAFKSLIDQGASKFRNGLRPCCEGIENDANCGEVDAKGVKLYMVCRDPKSSFYWDRVHPTQAAWAAVFEALKPSLGEFFH